MILSLVDTAVASGARRAEACARLSIDPRTLERWRASGALEDGRRGPRKAPHNKLSNAERERLLAVATSEPYRDLSPKQIVPRLADACDYVGSESTLYRVLRAHKLMTHRGKAKPPVSRPRAEHIASGPCQVWSWDISYLRTPIRGQYFYLYLMMDVWSRKIVGFAVHDAECTDLASVLLRSAIESEGCYGENLVLHADNGGTMKGATLKATMEHLGVIASYSRPRVSDDNPFSEALFRTVKYRPEYPNKPFASLEEARAWVAAFVAWYNDVHLHSAIGYVTPAARHDGRDEAILAARRAVYEEAHDRNPERWSGHVRPWLAPATVRLNPIQTPYANTTCETIAA